MKSADKRRANRANARLSTGPKTAKGKARAAKNALRHGLSLSVLGDPDLAKEVEVGAQRIAGAAADPATLARAGRIAEAQIDLQRVRTYRHRRIDQVMADPNYEGADVAGRKLALSMRLLWRGAGRSLPAWAAELSQTRALAGPEKLATIIADLARELAALDRYERRALSRRKFAIRAFDKAADSRGGSKTPVS